MEVIIQDTAATACKIAARLTADLVRKKPNAVLGLATGTTPLPCYEELIRLHVEESLDFSKVTTFNLDEYVGLPHRHPQSYRFYMNRNLFNKINIPEGNIHVPDGMSRDIAGHCAEYEERIRNAGGIDFQLLGIGHDGHIGFNEPTSSLASRTRIKTLTRQTRQANARFFKSMNDVPHHVITMGIGTIMESRMCVMLVYGDRKANAVADMVEGPVTAMCPASILQFHPNAKIVLDRGAASGLKHADYYKWVFDNKPDWQS